MFVQVLSVLLLIGIFGCSSSDEPVGGREGRGGSSAAANDAGSDVGRAGATSTGGTGGKGGTGGDTGGAGGSAGWSTDGGGSRSDAPRTDGSGGQSPIDAGSDGRGGSGGAGGTGASGGAGGSSATGGASGTGGTIGTGGSAGGGTGGASGTGGAAGTGGTGTGGTAGSGGSGGTGGAGGDPFRIAYFAAWGVYARSYFVKNIESSGAADQITHINYAFANISSDLKCAIGDNYADYDKAYDATTSVDGVADTWDTGTLRGSFNQLKKLKAKHPSLKVLISIGGWTWSDKFSNAALTPESRRTLVKSCVDMYIKGAFAAGLAFPGIFDGIDVDWEYPAAPGNSNNYRPEDTANFTALLAEFRAELDTQGALDGKRYLLTIAAPAGKDKFTKIEIGKIHPYLDTVNLMTYDMHGAWETVTNFHAPLKASSSDPTSSLEYDTDHAVQGWLAAMPAKKLVVGLPFYGRGWKGVPAGPASDGLYQTATGAGAQGTYEAGIEDYKVLKNLGAAYKPFRHPDTRAFWVYSAADGVFWSYDDPTALTEKAAYIKSKGLGGAMVWELSGDDGAGTLMKAVADGLR